MLLEESDLLEDESRSILSESDEEFRECFRSSRILHIKLFRSDLPVMHLVSIYRVMTR